MFIKRFIATAATAGSLLSLAGPAVAYFSDDFTVRSRYVPSVIETDPETLWPDWIGQPGVFRRVGTMPNMRITLPIKEVRGDPDSVWPSWIGR